MVSPRTFHSFVRAPASWRWRYSSRCCVAAMLRRPFTRRNCPPRFICKATHPAGRQDHRRPGRRDPPEPARRTNEYQPRAQVVTRGSRRAACLRRPGIAAYDAGSYDKALADLKPLGDAFPRPADRLGAADARRPGQHLPGEKRLGQGRGGVQRLPPISIPTPRQQAPARRRAGPDRVCQEQRSRRPGRPLTPSPGRAQGSGGGHARRRRGLRAGVLPVGPASGTREQLPGGAGKLPAHGSSRFFTRTPRWPPARRKGPTTCARRTRGLAVP